MGNKARSTGITDSAVLRFQLTSAAILAVLVGQMLPGKASATSKEPSSKAAQEEWRTSSTELIVAIDAFRRTGASFPAASPQMMKVGEPIPPNWPVMKRSKGPVVLEGELIGVESDSKALMRGQSLKLKIKSMVEQEAKTPWVHVYARDSAVPKWKSIAAGSTVRFKSEIAGIAAMVSPFDKGGPGGSPPTYIVLLTNAEPLAEKQ